MGLLLVDDSENVEMSMSKRGIEVDTLKKRVKLNGRLSRRKGTLGILESSVKMTKRTRTWRKIYGLVVSWWFDSVVESYSKVRYVLEFHDYGFWVCIARVYYEVLDQCNHLKTDFSGSRQRSLVNLLPQHPHVWGWIPFRIHLGNPPSLRILFGDFGLHSLKIWAVHF